MENATEPEFRLIKAIDRDVWLAERTRDREPFIARRLAEFDDDYTDNPAQRAEIDGIAELFGENHSMMRAMGQILHHENIVSLAGHIDQEPPAPATASPNQREGRYTTWLVWDYCDAGSLETLLADRRLQRKMARQSGDGIKFLPENLCWHVLVSMLRALAWLHDGVGAVDVGGSKTQNRRVDEDWMPILHGSLVARNIHFQHPRGRETFGLCKLANFGTAFVSGKTSFHAISDSRYLNPSPANNKFQEGGIVATFPGGTIAFGDTIREALEEDASPDVTPPNRPYTVHTELWNLGATVFRMMTNTELPSVQGCHDCEYKCTHLQACRQMFPGCLVNTARNDGCECKTGGCDHILRVIGIASCSHPPRSCPHSCSRRDVWYMHQLWKRPYSQGLIAAVSCLLRPAHGAEKRLPIQMTTNIAKQVDELYQAWKADTDEGKAFVDVDDDLRARTRAKVGAGLLLG